MTGFRNLDSVRSNGSKLILEDIGSAGGLTLLLEEETNLINASSISVVKYSDTRFHNLNRLVFGQYILLTLSFFAQYRLG